MNDQDNSNPQENTNAQENVHALLMNIPLLAIPMPAIQFPNAAELAQQQPGDGPNPPEPQHGLLQEIMDRADPVPPHGIMQGQLLINLGVFNPRRDQQAVHAVRREMPGDHGFTMDLPRQNP